MSPDNHSSTRTTIFSGKFRWVICAVLFLGISKNYMDRQVLGVLKVTLQHDLGWNEIDYSNLVFVFQAAYAVGMLVVGRFIDRVGTRMGYGLAMLFWSVASMAHALCGSLFSFEIARGALGLGEAGAFPASIKTVTEWFPRKERALATGIFNAGTNVGAIITPLFVPWITIRFGWRWAFLITGALGFLWFLLWMAVYRKPEDHPRCSPDELAVHPQRSRKAGGSRAVGPIVGISPDMGISAGKVSDRSHLVVLLILGAGLFSGATWVKFDADRIAGRRDLSDFRCRQRCGGLVVIAVY